MSCVKLTMNFIGYALKHSLEENSTLSSACPVAQYIPPVYLP